MTTRRGFVCGGCWTLDHIKLIEGWPIEETLARITGTDRQGGGSGHNLAMDMKKLDPSMPVEAIGMLGNDPDGDFLFANAEQSGIDTRQLHRSGDANTSYTDVMSVAGSGKRTFFHYMGANDLLSPDDFDFSATTCRILHLGLLGVHNRLDNRWNDDSNGWVTVLKNARQAGLQTNIELISIDGKRNRELCLPCLPYLDTLIVNDQEIGSLADICTISNGKTHPELCLEAARLVLAKGSMRLVVVHYPAGAVCITRGGQIVLSQAVVVDPATIGSSVGAGDAFAAGMLYGLHEEWSIEKSLELAHAAAAASLRSQTTIGSVEDVAGCLRLAGH